MAKPKRYLETVPGVDSNNNINVLSDELKEIRTGNQARVDASKARGVAYNVDDFIYRAKEFHPELTREQVYDVYASTPIIASNKNSSSAGEYKYNPNDQNDDTNRIMVYDKGLDAGNIAIDDNIAHEISHTYKHKLYGNNLTSKEKELLKAAYNDRIFVGNGDDDSMTEQHAANREFRSRLSRAHGNAIGKDLDKVIENASDDEMMNIYFNLNGYTEDDPFHNSSNYMKRADGSWDSEKIKPIRTALKHVASNNRKFSIKNKNNVLS